MGPGRPYPVLIFLIFVSTCGPPDSSPPDSSTHGKETISKTREVDGTQDIEVELPGFKPNLDPEASETVNYVIGNRSVSRAEFQEMLDKVYISAPAASHGHGHTKTDCGHGRGDGTIDPDCVPGEHPTFHIEFTATHRSTGEAYTYGRRETKNPGSPVTTHRLSLKKNFHTKVMRSKRP